MMRLPGNIRVTQALRRWRSRLRPGVAILGYHRVDDCAPDPLELSISPAHFAAHLDVISRICTPLSLADALAALAARRLPPGAIVVTFDDGYSDMLDSVLPLLERYQIPATLFATSGNPGGEFWWDRFARLYRSDGGTDIFTMADRLQALDDAARDAALERLAREAGTVDGPRYRTLTADELAQLAASRWIEIGAHTVSHRPLPSLTAAAQRDELVQSRAALEQLIGRPVTSFAYPHGRLDEATIGRVREAGYRAACASTVDVARPDSPVLALPRLWPRNVDGAAFEHWLRGWLRVG
jgi:peptidoglycan/xylan/chitin deacetylase (PgdA/CDA1 family)